MKNLPNHTTLLIVLFQLMQFTLCAQNDSLVGNWSGVFMDQFNMSFNIRATNNAHYSGQLEMFADKQQIQNDEITQITLIGNELSFIIEAKDTWFRGLVNFESQQINGHFIFPDGSQHPVLVYRVENVASESDVSSVDFISAKLPVDLMKSDLHFLVDKLTEMHPRLYAYTSSADFEQQVEITLNKLNSDETIVDFYNKITSVTDVVGCSHTGIRLPQKTEEKIRSEGNYLPARIYIQNNKAYYITGEDNKSNIPPGAELLSINDMAISIIIDKAFKYVPAEGRNLNTKYNQINRNFYDYYVLIDNAETFKIEYTVPGNNKVNTKILAASTYQKSKELYPQSVLLMNEFPISFELQSESNTCLLTIESFGIRDVNRYIHYMDSVFNLLKVKNINNLILDLRDNSGGHPIFAAQLFSYLAGKPFLYFDTTSYKVPEFAPLYTLLQPNPIHYNGNCLILVNGGCLSTTGHFISLVKFNKLGIFIGEEPGSTYQCNDNSHQFVLPGSGIELNVPTTIFRTSVGDFFEKNPTIVDIRVDIEIKDVIDNSDKCLGVAYKQINNSYTLND